MNQIKSTTTYDKFVMLEQNRDIIPSHVKHLKKSFKTRNFMQYLPILVDENLNVIDGQHRLLAAKELGIPVYYMIVSELEHKDIITFNATSRRWNMGDYLKYWVHAGLPDYIVMKDFVEKYGFNLNITIAILSLGVYKGNLWELFRRGDFKIKDVSASRILAEKVLRLQPFHEGRILRDFVYATKKLEDFGISIDTLIYKIKDSRIKIQKSTSTLYYLRQFEFILNFRRKKEENYIKII